ncbi:hypothetical protein NQZ68_036963 [Dissostichus eleginoides]|nr:hypothetical protein NQZ68_036963 [Dissostichus eleginoides]
MLLDEAEVVEGMLSTLASFVCAAYSPKGINIKTIPKLRWHLFCKHRAESDKLPQTFGALKQHILRVHVQTRVWAQAAIALQDPQLDPLHNGYFRDSDGMKPTTTEVLPGRKAIIEMLQCRWGLRRLLLFALWHCGPDSTEAAVPDIGASSPAVANVGLCTKSMQSCSVEEFVQPRTAMSTPFAIQES